MSHESAPSPDKPRIRTPKALRRVGEATLDTLARFRMLRDDTESGRPLEERHIPQKTPAELGARAIGKGLISLRRPRHSKEKRNPATYLSVENAQKIVTAVEDPRHLYTHRSDHDGINSAYKDLGTQHRH